MNKGGPTFMRFRKKPVIIDAFQCDGDNAEAATYEPAEEEG